MISLSILIEVAATATSISFRSITSASLKWEAAIAAWFLLMLFPPNANNPILIPLFFIAVKGEVFGQPWRKQRI